MSKYFHTIRFVFYLQSIDPVTQAKRLENFQNDRCKVIVWCCKFTLFFLLVVTFVNKGL